MYHIFNVISQLLFTRATVSRNYSIMWLYFFSAAQIAQVEKAHAIQMGWATLAICSAVKNCSLYA